MPKCEWSFSIDIHLIFANWPRSIASGPISCIMRKSILLLILLCSTLVASTQSIRFSRYYDLSDLAYSTGAIEVLPQGYAMLLYDNCTGGGSLCTTLAITDTLGELLQQKTFPGLILEGMTYHPEDSTFLFSGRFPLTNQDDAPCLLKINYQGDTLWSFSANPPHADFGRKMLELPDKSILLPTGPQFLDSNEATIIKTDSMGNLLWIKGYDTGNYFKNYDVQGLMLWQDSTVLICANGIEPNEPGDFLDSGFSLFQIDYDGNLLYDTAYQIEPTNYDAHTRLAKIPGNRIVTSSGNSLFYPIGNSGTNLVAVNMDDKSIDWSLGFPESFGHAIISQLSTTLDSGIVACGRTYTTVFPEVLPTSWILKSNAEGQLEWQRFLSRTLAFYISDIEPTPDGGYIMAGIYEDPDYYIYTVLIKLDGHGCLQPNCDSLLLTTFIAEPGADEVLGTLKIQPNPSDALLVINTEGLGTGKLRVIDMLGYIVAETIILGDKTTIPVNHCANGMYLVQYLDAAGKVGAMGRVVIEH